MTSRTSNPCLSVVVPCYDELATIRELLKRVLESEWVAEVIVVDDGSTDGTREVLADVDDVRVHVLLQPTNAGKGAALQSGFAAAIAAHVIVQDATRGSPTGCVAERLGPQTESRRTR